MCCHKSSMYNARHPQLVDFFSGPRCCFLSGFGRPEWLPLNHTCYGVVSKELLTFLGSLYKEVAKTTSGTFMYRFVRKKPSEIVFST